MDVPEAWLRPAAWRPLALVGIVGVAALARLWGIGFGLPHTWSHNDEIASVAIARRFLGGDLRPHFFDWPTLYTYVLAAVYAGYYLVGHVMGAFGAFADFAAAPLDTPRFFLIARWVAALLGTATVPVVWRIGERLYDRATGLVAALFLALAFLHVRESHFGVPDAPVTFLIMSSVLFVLRAHEGGLADHAVAGLLAGLATATKYNAALVGAPMLASVAIRSVGAATPADRARALRGLALFVAAAAAAFVAAMPWAVLDPGAVLTGVARVQAHLHEGHAIDLGRGWLYHLRVSLRHGLGWPLLVAGLVGLARTWTLDWRRAAILSAFPVTYYLVMGEGRTVFVRHALPLVPFLCIAGAALVVAAGRRVATAVRRPGLFAGATAVLAALVIAPSAVSVVRCDRLLARTDSRVLAADWLRAHLAPASSLYQNGTLHGQVQLGGRPPVERWTYDEHAGVFVAPGRATGRLPDWIVLQESPLVLYSEVPAGVRRLVESRDYELVHVVQAAEPGSRGNVFAEQDAFFLPFAGFHGVHRPGPSFRIYRRSASA